MTNLSYVKGRLYPCLGEEGTDTERLHMPHKEVSALKYTDAEGKTSPTEDKYKHTMFWNKFVQVTKF